MVFSNDNAPVKINQVRPANQCIPEMIKVITPTIAAGINATKNNGIMNSANNPMPIIAIIPIKTSATIPNILIT
jgi:hypothetical protein